MNVLSWSNVLKFPFFPPASYFFRSFLHRTVCIFCSTCFGCLYLPPLLSLTHLHQQVLELLCVVNHLLECIIKLEYLIFTYEKSFTIYQKIKIFQVNATRTQKKKRRSQKGLCKAWQQQNREVVCRFQNIQADRTSSYQRAGTTTAEMYVRM